MRNRKLVGRLALLLLVVALGAVACSSPATTSVRGEATLRSQNTVLAKVGADDSRTYGWNQLTGTTDTTVGLFDVALLGSVDYERGSGPFSGFLTLTAANGDRIATRVDGEAKVVDNGTTELIAGLKVIDGSGEYVGVGGHGRFTGSRSAQLGAPIVIEIDLELER